MTNEETLLTHKEGNAIIEIRKRILKHKETHLFGFIRFLMLESFFYLVEAPTLRVGTCATKVVTGIWGGVHT